MGKSGTVALALAAMILVAAADPKTVPVFPKAKPTGWTAPLAALGIDGTVDRLAEPHNWRIKQVSSYDPTGGNNDDKFGHQIYDGGIVLADLQGPGAVMRIWTRNPWGTLYIYVDDMEHPLITTPFEEFFKGDLELFSPGFNLMSPPFVDHTSGGYFSYIPIPYKERCRIIVTGEVGALGYQVTYAEFPKGTPLESFQLKLNKGDVNYFRNWRDAWTHTTVRFVRRDTERFHKSSTIIFPQKSALVLPIEGPGVLTEIEMKIASVDPNVLRNVWISVQFDGQEEPGVLAPIGDLFSTSRDAADHDSLVLGRDDGRMWCRYPMPFKSSAVIRVWNATDQSADFEYSFTWKTGPIDDALYFFARYRSGQTEKGVPYRVADIRGDGHFVGANVTASDADSLTFLEGDDLYLVDGEPGSSFHGTGTDDYFNAGWYFSTGPFSVATHGNTVKDASAPTGFAAYRSLVTDLVPFRSSFVFELEHGDRNDQPGLNYTSVAYWYQKSSKADAWPIAAWDKLDF